MRIKRHSISWLGIILYCYIMFHSPNVLAACILNVQNVTFGNYDVFDNNHLDSTGNINVTCDTVSTYTISLSPGNGSFTNRVLLSGPNNLVYNLFVDAARTIVWGDGSGASATVTGTTTNANHTVYGRIPARQNVVVGSYQDSVTVTIVF